MTHYWDAHDPKLIVCEAKILMDIFHKKEKEEKKIVSLSKTMDDGPVSSSVLWQRMKKFLLMQSTMYWIINPVNL